MLDDLMASIIDYSSISNDIPSQQDLAPKLKLEFSLIRIIARSIEVIESILSIFN